MKTFGRPLFGELSTWIFESITISPRGSDTVIGSVTETAGLGLHTISYKKNFAVDLINCCLILKIIMYKFISFTGLSVVRPLNYYLEVLNVIFYVIIGHL